MQSLYEEVTACTHCAAHLPLPPRPILQIHPDAKILVAGQAPGVKAHERQKPFADASGQRLRSWLGVDEATFYNPRQIAIVPMGFCYPGKGKSGDLPPRVECAQLWRQRILEQLTGLELILVIGQYAQAWHLPERDDTSVTATVAGWQSYWPGILPLPHPSPRNIAWFKAHPWFEAEVIPRLQQRVRELIGTQ